MKHIGPGISVSNIASPTTASIEILSSVNISGSITIGDEIIFDKGANFTSSWADNAISSSFAISASWVLPKERQYDSSGSYAYCGTAAYGALEASSVWFITRLFISSSGNTTISSASMVNWTNRYTHTYY